jgi:hypothetical protein
MWTLRNNAGVVSCVDAGATLLVVRVTSPDLGSGFQEAFTCGPGMGLSRKVSPGTYDLEFELSGPRGALGTSPRQRLIVTKDAVVAATPLVIMLT